MRRKQPEESSFVLIFFKKSSLKQALEECEQHKRENECENQIKPIYNRNAFFVPIIIFRKSQFGE